MHVRTYAPPCGAPGFAHTYVGETQKSATSCELGIGTNAIVDWNGTTRPFANVGALKEGLPGVWAALGPLQGDARCVHAW